MPGVLVELGYISTPDEERYLLTESGTDALALSIYQAFSKYKTQNISSSNKPKAKAPIPSDRQEPKPSSTPSKPAKEPVKVKPSPNDSANKPVFKIQILTSEKKLSSNNKSFKGLSPVNYYQENGIYKYTYGESSDYNKVLRTKREISSKFKGAFIIAFKNGKKVNVNEAIKEFKSNR